MSSVNALEKPDLPLAAQCNNIKIAAEGFVSVFYQQLVKSMQSGQESNQFMGGKAEQAYRGLQEQYYGEALAKADHSGLVSTIARQMSKDTECKGFFDKQVAASDSKPLDRDWLELQQYPLPPKLYGKQLGKYLEKQEAKTQ